MARKKKETDDFVEVDFFVEPRLGRLIYAMAEYHGVPFETFRDKFLINALEEKVWHDTPKTITAGTDGTVRIEMI